VSDICVRFAPSPTGYVHVGSLRTALYNYLFAKHHDGKFVLRVEDTDQARITEGAVENLLETLSWSGLSYDEGPDKGGENGPYYQSQRLDIYNKHIEELISKDYAYPCFCSEDRLEKMREEQIKNKLTPKYDGHCRNIEKDESSVRRKKETHVIRLKVPEDGQTSVSDIIRGDVHFQNEMIDDQVLLKSDGFPTYHLANVVDDHLMGITHVIRGEEWLNSTPKHILLYNYFGWNIPEFAHLPLLLNPDRSKLSKRQGDVAVEDYRKKGYLPEALLNFVALLGWNRGDDEEIFSLEDLIKDFSLERVNKSGAVFNIEKLNWMNGLYIRNLPEDQYVNIALEYMKEGGIDSGDQNKNKQIVLAVRNSVETFGDIKDRTELFFTNGPLSYTKSAEEWVSLDSSKQVFTAMLTEINKHQEITLDSFKAVMGNVQSNTGVKGKDLWMPVRAALTGMTEGPELPQVIQIFGKEKIVTLLKQAIDS
jgi:glutamyl-tRNA synthetase